ncbi:MAG: N-acetylglucosaminyl-diphospho-decaprenol L-rhamnosyltransferase [Pontimonas sp.]|jgi:N-acetylglucosaminyl-diphospho-decaprenol L-rhamnosyltransferase
MTLGRPLSTNGPGAPNAMKVQKTLGLVVIGYRSDEVWEPFLDSLRSSTITPAAIVVVENSPAVSPALRSFPDLPITVVHRSDNPGYGAAANAGVAALNPDMAHIVICNPDVTVHPTALAMLLSTLETDVHTGTVGPRLLTTRGEVYPSARAIPGIRIGIGHALLGNMWPTNPWSHKYLGDYERMEPHSVGWLSGAFLLVRRAAFDAVGGFDEGYFMFFEDVDLGFRLKRCGFRSIYVPAADVTHSGAHATQSDMPAMISAHHRSAARFLSVLYPRKRHIFLRAVLTLGLKTRSLIESRLAHNRDNKI